jgi:stress response protein YsnF
MIYGFPKMWMLDDVIVITSARRASKGVLDIIPVLEEEYSVSKKEIIEPSKIEKRWIKKTKTIKVPITHEEVYINDKKMRSVESTGFGIISSRIKDKINIGNTDSLGMKQSILKEDKIQEEDLVPLFSNGDITETDMVIPLFGEEIEVTKKMVKLGEIVIKKRRVTQKQKIDIDTKKEKVTIRYPDGTTELLN